MVFFPRLSDRALLNFFIQEKGKDANGTRKIDKFLIFGQLMPLSITSDIILKQFDLSIVSTMHYIIDILIILIQLQSLFNQFDRNFL